MLSDLPLMSTKLIAVDRLGSGIQVSATLKNSRPVGWLGLGSVPNIVGRLGSGVWVSASFQFVALIAGEVFYVGGRIVRAGEMSGAGPD